MNNSQVVACIVTRAGRSILNMLEMGEYVGQWDGSLSELENATAEAGTKVSKGTLSKAHTLFKHYGTDQTAVIAACTVAGKEATWKNAYDLLKVTTETPTVSEGNDEDGDEGETAGTTDKRRIVKIDLDDPLAALLKLSAEDCATIATALAAVLVDQEIQQAA